MIVRTCVALLIGLIGLTGCLKDLAEDKVQFGCTRDDECPSRRCRLPEGVCVLPDVANMASAGASTMMLAGANATAAGGERVNVSEPSGGRVSEQATAGMSAGAISATGGYMPFPGGAPMAGRGPVGATSGGAGHQSPPPLSGMSAGMMMVAGTMGGGMMVGGRMGGGMVGGGPSAGVSMPGGFVSGGTVGGSINIGGNASGGGMDEAGAPSGGMPLGGSRPNQGCVREPGVCGDGVINSGEACEPASDASSALGLVSETQSCLDCQESDFTIPIAQEGVRTIERVDGVRGVEDVYRLSTERKATVFVSLITRTGEPSCVQNLGAYIQVTGLSTGNDVAAMPVPQPSMAVCPAYRLDLTASLDYRLRVVRPDPALCELPPHALQLNVTAACGDGEISQNEECDDGNDIDDDRCGNDCVLRHRLGIACQNDEMCQPNGSNHVCREQVCVECDLQTSEGCSDEKPVCFQSDDGAPKCGIGCGGDNDADGCDPNGHTPICNFESGVCMGCHEVANERACASQLIGQPQCIGAGDFTGKCLAVCGDGIVAGSERCDPGDGLDENCVDCQRVECGDGIVSPNLGEQCDDGNRDNGDGCSDACTCQWGTNAKPAPSCAALRAWCPSSEPGSYYIQATNQQTVYQTFCDFYENEAGQLAYVAGADVQGGKPLCGAADGPTADMPIETGSGELLCLDNRAWSNLNADVQGARYGLFCEGLSENADDPRSAVFSVAFFSGAGWRGQNPEALLDGSPLADQLQLRRCLVDAQHGQIGPLLNWNGDDNPSEIDKTFWCCHRGGVDYCVHYGDSNNDYRFSKSTDPGQYAGRCWAVPECTVDVACHREHNNEIGYLQCVNDCNRITYDPQNGCRCGN